MTIRQMEIIVAVAEEQTLSSAAEKLFMTQPAVTKVISEVQKTYGLTLFRSQNHKLEPTPDGADLVSRAKSILHRYYELESSLLHAGERVQIRIGLCHVLHDSAVNRIIQRVRGELPNCTISFYRHLSRYVDKSMTRRELDIAVTESEPTGSRLEFILAGDNTHYMGYNRDLDCEKLHSDDYAYIVNHYPFCLSSHGSLGRKIYDRFAIRSAALSSSPFFCSCSCPEILRQAKLFGGIALLPRPWLAEEVESGQMMAVEGPRLNKKPQYYVSVGYNEEDPCILRAQQIVVEELNRGLDGEGHWKEESSSPCVRIRSL